MTDKKKITRWALIVIGIVVVVGIGYFVVAQNAKPGQYDTLAKCIKDSGAIFYGAFWCPHCQDQKAAFGSSAKYLPYVECSTADSNGQLPVCSAAKINAYPTWHFNDGSRQEGELSLAQLATKTSCQLP